MAKFKVGDRARIVADKYGAAPDTIGKECTVSGPLDIYDWTPVKDLGYEVIIDGQILPIFCAEDELAPLTPATIDTWAAESVKKVTTVKPREEVTV